jgi:hypothetical protein
MEARRSQTSSGRRSRLAVGGRDQGDVDLTGRAAERDRCVAGQNPQKQRRLTNWQLTPLQLLFSGGTSSQLVTGRNSSSRLPT